MTFLGNAFSLQMLEGDAVVKVTAVNPSEVPAEAVSCIGHADTAAVVGSILGRPVPANRVSVKLSDGDILYVAQLTGGRLPEGATTIPEGMAIKFLRVELTKEGL